MSAGAGKTLAELIEKVKVYINNSTDSANNSLNGQITSFINDEIINLQDAKNFQYLQFRFDIEMQAGQQYYPIPDGFDTTRFERVWVKFSSRWIKITDMRNISTGLFNQFDSDKGQTSSYPTHWTLEDFDGAPHIRVYPIPSTNAVTNDDQILRVEGMRQLTELVDVDDVCELDYRLIAMPVAIRIDARRGKWNNVAALKSELTTIKTNITIKEVDSSPFTISGETKRTPEMRGYSSLVAES